MMASKRFGMSPAKLAPGPVANQEHLQDALGNRSGITYDALDSPLTTTDPLGHVSTLSYDADGINPNVHPEIADVFKAAFGVEE